MTRTDALPHLTFTAPDLDRFAWYTAQLAATGDAGAHAMIKARNGHRVTVWADGDVTVGGILLLRR